MYLMGISTILALQLIFFHFYINYEDEAMKSLDIDEQIETIKPIAVKRESIKMPSLEVVSLENECKKPIAHKSEKTLAKKPKVSQNSLGFKEIDILEPVKDLKKKQLCQQDSNLSLNLEGNKLYEDLKNNPFLNLSPDKFKQIQLGEYKSQGSSNNQSERLAGEKKLPHCQCNLEKDNFKIIIKAKSQRILSFLTLLERFYMDLMKTEQLCGRNLSKLGQPTISILGQFNEPILFKEMAFDDFQQIAQSKKSLKSNYAFCKWRIIRKVFNEIGVCHAENALFYREGVLANIFALNETVQNNVKLFQQQHIVLCEDLEKSEKKLLKMKAEYAKSNEIVEESITNYTKATQTIKNYEKVLELEMKFKLSYKQMQDNVSKVSDALDSMCETREKFQQETQNMLQELRFLDRNKVEIFKSTLMSVVDTHYDFETQIQSFFEECLKQSNAVKIQLKAQMTNQSPLSNSNISGGAGGQSSSFGNSNEEEEFFKIQRKRSVKYKVEEVKNLIDELGADDFDNENVNEKDDKISFDSINFSAHIQRNIRQPGDSSEEEKYCTDIEEKESIGYASQMGNNFQIQTISKHHDYSPTRVQASTNSMTNKDNKCVIFDGENKSFKDFDSKIIQSPQSNNISFSLLKAMSNFMNPDKVDTTEAERILQQHSIKFDQQSRQTQLMIQGLKDLMIYIQSMKEIVHKYYEGHSLSLNLQFEEVKHIPQKQNQIGQISGEDQDAHNIPNQTISKIKQLKIKLGNNEGIHKVWQSFINNYKSYLHQYEMLDQKLLDIKNSLELHISAIQNMKNQTDLHQKSYNNRLKQAVNGVKQSIAQLKYIRQQQQQLQERSIMSESGRQNYQQYYQQYQNMKLLIQNPSPILKIAYSGNLPSEEQGKEYVIQQFQVMQETQHKYQDTFAETQKEIEKIQIAIKDQMVVIKHDIIAAHQERSKNSQGFFQNIMEQIESIFSENNEGETQIEDDLTSELIACEDLPKNMQLQGHKQGCFYYIQNEKQQSESQINNQIKLSPDKKMINNIDNTLLQQSSNRNRSQSHYLLNQSLIDQTQLPNPLENLDTQSKSSFNFGNQINIVNNFAPGFQPQKEQIAPGINEIINNAQNVETANWFNKILQVYYNAWKTSQVFQNFILKEAYIIANKGRPKMLSEIEVHKVVLHGKAPEFQRIQKLDSHPDDFLYDIDLSLRSPVEILIKTEINFKIGSSNNVNIPLTVNIILRSINGKLRVFYSNDASKGCWYGFVGKPVIKFNLDPIIGKDNKFSIKYIPRLRELIEDLIGKRFDKYCLPNKRPLSLPLTKVSNTQWPRIKKGVDQATDTNLDMLNLVLAAQGLERIVSKKRSMSFEEIDDTSIAAAKSKGNTPLMSRDISSYEEAIRGGLQGVIIAESFQKKFRPVSHERLKCMFPVANVNLLHYTIEFLLMNKVTEIFIATCVNRGQIDQFIKNQNYKGVKIHVIALENSTNFGDALREINQLQTIKSDFILAKGDIITNADIQDALKEHYKVKADDKERKLILTKLFVKIPFSNSIRSKQQELALILDDQSKEILKYESFEQSGHKMKINEEYIPMKQSTRQYEIRIDLVDSEVCICSRDVLNYFTDNFDYSSLSDDFINQIQSSEIIDDRIMAYEINGGYYARILDPRNYGAITQDILSRHLHPMTLDSKLLCPKNNYTFHSFNKYYDQGVQIALNTTVSNNCAIGIDTKIGTHSEIERSTIGKKCIIGKNVKIRNSYIWNNVEIQDGSEIEDSIICDNVVIKIGAKIHKGSVISFGVQVKERAIVPEGSIASRFTFNSETMAFEEVKKFQSELFDVGLIPYLPRDCQLVEHELLGNSSPYKDHEESDFEDDEDEDMMEDNEKTAFINETRKTIDRCVKNKFPISNAIMEMKSLKMTYNMDYQDCVEAFMPVLLDFIGQMENSDQAAQRAKNIETFLTEWKSFIRDFVREEPDQYTLIRSVELHSGTTPLFNNSFHIVIQVLFKLQLLSGSVITSWSERAQESLKSAKQAAEADEDEDIQMDDIFDHIKPEQREKFVQAVS